MLSFHKTAMYLKNLYTTNSFLPDHTKDFHRVCNLYLLFTNFWYSEWKVGCPLLHCVWRMCTLQMFSSVYAGSFHRVCILSYKFLTYTNTFETKFEFLLEWIVCIPLLRNLDAAITFSDDGSYFLVSIIYTFLMPTTDMHDQFSRYYCIYHWIYIRLHWATLYLRNLYLPNTFSDHTKGRLIVSIIYIFTITRVYIPNFWIQNWISLPIKRFGFHKYIMSLKNHNVPRFSYFTLHSSIFSSSRLLKNTSWKNDTCFHHLINPIT